MEIQRLGNALLHRGLGLLSSEPLSGNDAIFRRLRGRVRQVEFAFDQVAGARFGIGLAVDHLTIHPRQAPAHHRVELRVRHAGLGEGLRHRVHLIGLDIDDEPVGRIGRGSVVPRADQIIARHGEQQQCHQADRKRHRLQHAHAATALQYGQCKAPPHAERATPPQGHRQGAQSAGCQQRKHDDGAGKPRGGQRPKLDVAR